MRFPGVLGPQRPLGVREHTVRVHLPVERVAERLEGGGGGGSRENWTMTVTFVAMRGFWTGW